MNDKRYDYQEFWNAACDTVKKNSKDNDYDIWFRRITYMESSQGLVTLAVPSQFVCDRVTKMYKDEIASTLSELVGERIEVSFIVKKDMPLQQQKESAPEKQESSEEAKEKKLEEARKKANVNSSYLFSNFVTGDNCTYAYNASLAIAKNPGTSYNPCLIYGKVGIGKTHLINAIGNYILETQPDLRVLYITAEAFTNEFIEAIGKGIDKSQQFKNKFRKVDVLLMDDIQFIQNKTQSQEELFHTFNELYESKHQIVFACDRPINELEGVMDRLTNRFERGLSVDLQPPAYETRVAIIKNKCKLQNKYIAEDIVNYIAQNVSSNVRDLEASLTKLVSYSELLGQELTMEKAKELLSVMPFFQPENKKQGISVSSIIKTVCNYYNVNSSDVKSKKKNKSLVQPRQIAMYLSKQLTSYSFTEIGEEFGNRDHTTVMHACDRINSFISVNPEFKGVVDKLKKEIEK
jgi:chromosomal replication initiator protein